MTEGHKILSTNAWDECTWRLSGGEMEFLENLAEDRAALLARNEELTRALTAQLGDCLCTECRKARALLATDTNEPEEID